MDRLVDNLSAIVGPENVLSKADELLVYECDGLPQHKYRPRAVIFPSSTEETAAIMRELAGSDPGNKGWQGDLAIAMEKTADATLAAGDIDAALKLYDEQLKISRALVESDPENTEWQRGLSVALERTWTGTWNFLANSMLRLCITPAPRLASSMISS